MKYKKEHLETIQRMMKGAGMNAADRNMVCYLYKLYIDPADVNNCENSCSSCSSGVQTKWKKVKDYIYGNSSLFVEPIINKKK